MPRSRGWQEADGSHVVAASREHRESVKSRVSEHVRSGRSSPQRWSSSAKVTQGHAFYLLRSPVIDCLRTGYSPAVHFARQSVGVGGSFRKDHCNFETRLSKTSVKTTSYPLSKKPTWVEGFVVDVFNKKYPEWKCRRNSQHSAEQYISNNWDKRFWGIVADSVGCSFPDQAVILPEEFLLSHLALPVKSTPDKEALHSPSVSFIGRNQTPDVTVYPSGSLHLQSGCFLIPWSTHCTEGETLQWTPLRYVKISSRLQAQEYITAFCESDKGRGHYFKCCR